MPKELIHNDSRTRSNKNKNLTFQLTENVGTPKKILTNSFFIRSMSHWNTVVRHKYSAVAHSLFLSNLKF